ncbi:Asp-tRNA(Asn)/Glu-tRNA(Gln) amidotransferase subunit GatA [Moraxella bovis]|uniref:Glutamyl-tRNA(Gln) amidotransferase subunit A n=1 Tax=Moraxella bovis TaxID=476 RepID=A0AAQ2T1F9_MORBO|nr:Asp-tRNA(Asn)/Glu-tRNA(Gln) amidotransferase subunit GatA [Moraxella bovis]UYZ75612.1 Asp-tRNA(Asn)/Glu-tRNA(Gln) amidotransferase subunit GatA [Moraxella bovis]UYZ78446.1 Asp-tRNA(Asn)/Glu-tRNA(Gln) amidotransferase subunit GatA [Moraxella bovis]UYZ81333.1 Asp-tRNA(Asn)/Glu-tRNA(Gln) amidotransferase subunit GatA [Moraxella bovis]UYZ86928.1 Asp-tRNA(Asn)/Glu-tRNA(Gln) amidotransferase subunit GatA [Moraxella bovis]UYZ92357.1 Asp-tRNA(Asn)/Glu-tRNA(Gln) amidotransferase subunit GatA [Moraxe
MTDLHHLSVHELADGLKNKQFSSQELVKHFASRIDSLDEQINSFITKDFDNALKHAELADKLRAEGDTRPLLGVPMAHKDNLCTKGVLTSAGSKILSNFVSPYDATVVENIANAGFISLGKLNMDEFAMGSDNESSYFGAVHNPWDTARVPGGSSGGSAAAVASGFVPVATGSDTGGSIRQPASFCGITGIKPTYGRVSRYGMIAYASSLDQAGTFGKSALDCAYLLSPMTGHDPKDATSINRSTEDYVADILVTKTDGKPLAGKKIGVAKAYFGAGLDSEVEKSIRTALAKYEELGAQIVEVDITDPAVTLATYYLLAPAEASSNLSRYDGVRFGYRCEDPKDLIDLYTRSRSEGFGTEVQRRIIMGTYALSAGYFDAYYTKAQKVRRLIVDDFKKAFEKCDIIASPTAPTTAYKLGENLDPASIYLGDVYTIGVNLAGLPALSHPVGQANGLPVGLQLIGKHWAESELLKTAHVYQANTKFHQEMADLVK